MNEIENGEIKLADVKNNQEIFKSNLSEIRKESNNNSNKKSKEQKNTIQNIKMLYKSRNEVIKFFDDYSIMASETKNETTKGTGLKILIPKQMLQRLPIAFAQVKAGKNSENLLIEIRKIVYLLYQSKEITKKLDNNIINPIQ